MITAVTLNAAVDKSYHVHQLQRNKTNRVTEVIAVPGGKGINVARVAHMLGAEVTASGFVGGTNGDFIHRGLEQAGLISDFVRVEGNSRETIAIFDASQEGITEFLEPGPVIAAENDALFAIKLKELAAKSKVVAFSGSIPQGLSPDIYAKLIEMARQQGAVTILDASGDALSRGFEGKPDICKPNRDELEQWLGYRPHGHQEVTAAAKQLVDQGVKLVIVSMDKEGSIAVTSQAAWHIIPPVIQAVNTVGCGDSLVAGIACYLNQLDPQQLAAFSTEKHHIEQALKLGTAAAASNALHRSAGMINLDEVHRFFDLVRVTEL
ncbi:1-phosphofructokinase family hexose kinase [Paenibacillus eucommiae]|uniref:Tagatose-6-phosphate kinase n=1 Tax=Paenibacillus eucommiae TaxID=1355755 RepID=A0ABS4J8C4_9BACL|nr:1-phosphofructokinase family hexose kinase [Paenibacillus eucommiae]MBP1996092.1 1-phosphofructokinase family hexose kinase [Paenibacillus eucommiae]